MSDKYTIKCWCGTMVESVPMLLGYFDEKGHQHDPNTCELGELRKLRDGLIAVARKLGSGMPIMTDGLVQRANELQRIGQGSREEPSPKFCKACGAAPGEDCNTASTLEVPRDCINREK